MSMGVGDDRHFLIRPQVSVDENQPSSRPDLRVGVDRSGSPKWALSSLDGSVAEMSEGVTQRRVWELDRTHLDCVTQVDVREPICERMFVIPLPQCAVHRIRGTLADDQPEPFLEVLVQDMSSDPTLTALSVGFDNDVWRGEAFARHLFEWLPDFALRWTEREGFSSGRAVELMRRAAQVVYSSEKYSKRGEFGELILHAVARQVFGSEPAISKIYYKDSSNDTVKGFDAVHVVVNGADLELWLGEAKLYGDLSSAISAVVGELQKHTQRDYLKGEFALLTNKVDDSWPYAERFRRLIHQNTPLDEVFTRLRIPVLLTYDSKTCDSYTSRTEEYCRSFEEEVKAGYASFASKSLPKILIHLVLVPLKNKDVFVGQLHSELKKWQTL